MVNFFFLIIFLCSALNCTGAIEPSSAQALLESARLRPTAHPITLAAQIRGGEEPLFFTFKIGKGVIEYQLHNPEELLTLTLGPTHSSLSDTQKEKSTFLGDEKRYQEIRHTGVTYDDLSLGFLYWSHPHIIRTESLRGMKTAVIELRAPCLEQSSKNASSFCSPYGSAHLWIDTQNGTPLRMEGYDAQGRLLKRFEVISAQKIDDLWMLKEMRIETFDPITQKVIQRRYLDFSTTKRE